MKNMRDWMIEHILKDITSLDKDDVAKVYKYIRRLRHGVDVEPK